MPRFCVRERDVINQNITLSSFYLPCTTRLREGYGTITLSPAINIEWHITTHI